MPRPIRAWAQTADAAALGEGSTAETYKFKSARPAYSAGPAGAATPQTAATPQQQAPSLSTPLTPAPPQFPGNALPPAPVPGMPGFEQIQSYYKSLQPIYDDQTKQGISSALAGAGFGGTRYGSAAAQATADVSGRYWTERSRSTASTSSRRGSRPARAPLRRRRRTSLSLARRSSSSRRSRTPWIGRCATARRAWTTTTPARARTSSR
jgi:hypothetical protein